MEKNEEDKKKPEDKQDEELIKAIGENARKALKIINKSKNDKDHGER